MSAGTVRDTALDGIAQVTVCVPPNVCSCWEVVNVSKERLHIKTRLAVTGRNRSGK